VIARTNGLIGFDFESSRGSVLHPVQGGGVFIEGDLAGHYLLFELFLARPGSPIREPG
jgi:hypothetical protein